MELLRAEAAAPVQDAGIDSWVVPFTPSSVRAARLNLTAAMRRNDVPQPVIDDAMIVVSELLGNAVRHAKPIPGTGLVLTLEIRSESVWLSVSDGGSATLPTLLHPPPFASSGRGLTIVRSLTAEWGVREGVAGNTVFAVLALV